MGSWVELGLGQKDVIGEWVPEGEPGLSDVIDPEHGLKWLRGIRVTEIDDNLILRSATSKRPEGIDLKKSRIVLAELKKYRVPSSGALIVCERTELPWRAHNFRIEWRKLATACGISENVYNMDSRPRRTDESPETGGPRQETESAG